MKKLPKYFVIERSEDPRRQKYVDWLNDKYGVGFLGESQFFYGYDGSCGCGGVDLYSELTGFKNNPTLITLDQREEATQEWKPKRGDLILVSDDGEIWKKRIYLATIEGTVYPIICVHSDSEEAYNENIPPHSQKRSKMKALPKKKKPKKEISDLGEKDVIRCKTKKQDKKIRKLLHGAGNKWRSGVCFLDISSRKNNGNQHCIRPKGERSGKEYYKENGYTIHKAKDFY